MTNLRENYLVNVSREKKAGLAYSLTSVLPVLIATAFLVFAGSAGALHDGVTTEDWYLYVNYLLPQIGLLAVLLFVVFYAKTPIKTVVSVPKPKYFLLAVFLQFALLSLSELNLLFLDFLGSFGYVANEIVLPSMDGFGFVGVLLVVAVLPAVMEEGVFRGVMTGGLRSLGLWKNALLCGALFALYHQNPAQTAYQFCCGFFYGLLAYQSGSALPTALAHFLNNAYILAMTKWQVVIPTFVEIPLLIVSGICLVAFVVYSVLYAKRKKQEETNEKTDWKGFLAYASVGLLIFLANWITTLVKGF